MRRSPPSSSPVAGAGPKANLERYRSLYEEIGADRCADGVRASIRFALGGASVEDAYDQVGLPLPPHPDGW